MDTQDAPKVSVIIPVYNSEEYVAHAAQSLLCQDFESFELILVDDGSTDGSGTICDELAASDSRIRVLHVENGGMCRARNLALDVARGAYVTFCDNDDECLPGFLSKNYQLAVEYDADVVRFGRRTETFFDGSDSPEVIEYAPSTQEVLVAEDVYKRFSLLMYGSNGVWTGLYRRELLEKNHIRFNEELRRGCEDKIFNLDVYDAAQVVCLNPYVYYTWRRRVSHSSSMSFDDNYYLGFGLYLHRLNAFIEDHDLVRSDPGLCSKEILSPFREMVGARVRSGEATYEEDVKFCAKVRAIYDGYWSESCIDPKIPQSLVLASLMMGNYWLPACALRVWRVKVGRSGGVVS